MAYPTADPNAPAAYPPATPGVMSAPVVEPRVLTATEQAEVDALYDQLKPQATAAARDYVLNRTPVAYQEAMVAKIDADWPLPPVA
jgi:hypothetical protein